MNSPEAHSLIRARSSTVWDVLTDAVRFPAWDSGITNIRGEIRNGGIITIRTRKRGRTRLRVEQLPGRVMTWTTGAPPLCSFVRTFTLTPEAGMTLLRVKDELRGPLRGLIGPPWAFTEEQLSSFVRAVTQRAELLA